jgi:hypothetical protein
MVPLLPLKLTEQSWHGLTHVLAVKVRPLVVVYRVVSFTSVGVPLMVQVVLLILKPAGSAGVIVQLAIASPELLKVISVMAKPLQGLLLAIQVVYLPVVQ